MRGGPPANAAPCEGSPIGLPLTLVTLVALVATGLWAELDVLAPWSYVATGAAVAALYVLMGGEAQPAAGQSARWPPLASPSCLVVGAIVGAAPAAFFVATYDQEFPFSGDHIVHLYSTIRASRFFTAHLAGIIAFGAFVAYGRRLLSPRVFLLLAFAILLVWGLTTAASPTWVFARYPAGGRVLAYPWLVIGRVLDLESPLNALRLSSVLALPTWAFGLRPLLLGRWPDESVLPFVALYVLQKDHVYYFSSSYLEPWAVVLVMVAAEAVLDRPTPAMPCALVGLAAVIKEQAILVLPWVWLATRPWRGSWVERMRSVLVLWVSAYPFLVYYLYRRDWGIDREARPLAASETLTGARLDEFLMRLGTQFGPSGLVLLAIVLGTLLFHLLRMPAKRWAITCVLAGGLFQIAFFFADSGSRYWTGNPRFHLVAYAMLAVPLLDLGTAWVRGGQPALAIVVAAVLALLQAPALISQFASTLERDEKRNATEHYDAPLYFPVRRLLRTIDDAHGLDGVQKLAVNGAPFGMEHIGRAYPRIAARFRVRVVPYPTCTCEGNGAAVLVAFPYRANLLEAYPERAAGHMPVGEAGLGAVQPCLSELESTCRTVYTEAVSGQVTLAIGVGASTGAPTRPGP